ncbi:CPBP family intramembrane metalloprotease [Sporosarcina sp. Marseille-Q4063]|uniref:CPBP family intramembrane glutamic endopeptidase n=1 Tax=Sporosarcina sp. Marseille-Q4063 TaxID=2810514 RepID=UPI001BB022E4|nr:CPBP family intramembrane glutamic endopeptidase [Sporosarcina sp. Marseille-Q4063]QUW22591.1 CPBP family intramembrane metalloprotease [Sporosarcina sp. Marseille-Q4063]
MGSSRKRLVPLIIFAILALSPLSGLAIIFAIFYIVNERRKFKTGDSVFTFHWDNTKEDIRKYWWLVLLPLASVFGQIVFAHYAMPTFNEHVMDRVAPMLHLGSLFILIPQLFILALGEELAFRGFAQEKLSNIINPKIAIILVSFLFAVGHLSIGPVGVVMYDVSFVFVDSILYGVLFLKTKNIYLTTIAHFLANLVGIYIFVLL